jgi:hypothetical protein
MKTLSKLFNIISFALYGGKNLGISNSHRAI